MNDSEDNYIGDQPQVPRSQSRSKPLDQSQDSSDSYEKEALIPVDEPEEEMSFLAHLEELRWHIIRAFIAMGICVIVAFIFSKEIWKYVILAPTSIDFYTFRVMCKFSELTGISAFCVSEPLPFVIQSRKVFGQFTTDLMVIFVIGLIISFPYIFWEIWRFLKPGLYPKERSAARGAVFWVSLLFFLGVIFGYFVVVPLSLWMLSNYEVAGDVIKNEFDILSVVSFLVTIILANGVLFQLPMVSLFLGKAGIIDAQTLRDYKKHAVVVILFLSAVITPPDVISQLLISFPLLILYWISIRIVARVDKKREEALR